MKILMVLVVMFTLFSESFMGGLWASDRVNDVFNDDIYQTLQDISQKQDEIKQTKEAMISLQAQLKTAKKGQATYITVRNVAGTLAIIAIAVGAYKIKFPRALKFNGLRLMLSSYLAVSTYGQGMVKLNQNDIENLSREIIFSLIKISKLESDMNKQIAVLCKQDQRHELCYKH